MKCFVATLIALASWLAAVPGTAQTTAAPNPVFDSLRAVAASSAPARVRLKAMAKLADGLPSTDSAQVMHYITGGQQLARQLADETGWLSLELHRARLLYDRQHYDSALHIAQQGLAGFTALNDSARMATTAERVGVSHAIRAQYPTALQYFETSLQIYTALNHPAKQPFWVIWAPYTKRWATTPKPLKATSSCWP